MPVIHDEFKQAKAKRMRGRQRDDRAFAIEVELRELANRIAELCQANDGSAAMVRVYTTAGHVRSAIPKYEVSASFYERMGSNTGGNGSGHSDIPLVAIKEAVP